LNNQKNNQIPESGHTYTKYRFKTETCILIYKKVGFTPVQVLNEIKPFVDDEFKTNMTFVGRLDPMAEGFIHIIWSGNVDEKKSLTLLDKEYEVDVLLGVHTDTDDILGLIESDENVDFDVLSVEKFVGPFEYNYPKYSSPHIKYVLKGQPFEYKKQDGYIYSIDFLGLEKFYNAGLKKVIFDKLRLCEMKGDFRLEEIKKGWKVFLKKNEREFEVVRLKVKCRRGTYMRVLAREMGGLAVGIVRREME
jgi:tRNA pseudouridine(55) synthase